MNLKQARKWNEENGKIWSMLQVGPTQFVAVLEGDKITAPSSLDDTRAFIIDQIETRVKIAKDKDEKITKNTKKRRWIANNRLENNLR